MFLLLNWLNKFLQDSKYDKLLKVAKHQFSIIYNYFCIMYIVINELVLYKLNNHNGNLVKELKYDNVLHCNRNDILHNYSTNNHLMSKLTNYVMLQKERVYIYYPINFHNYIDYHLYFDSNMQNDDTRYYELHDSNNYYSYLLLAILSILFILIILV